MRLTKIAFAAWVSLALFSSFALAERVVFPDALTEIKAGAFANDTSVTEVVFGESLTAIGENAFAGCGSLTDAWVYNIEKVNVGNGAFSSVSSDFAVQTFLGKMSATEIENAKALPARPRYRALLVGETYEGTNDYLRGCDEDANSMLQVLYTLNLTEYDTSSSDVIKLVNAPTTQILTNINALARDSEDTDVTLFYYSGHGNGAGTLVGYDSVNKTTDNLYPYILRNALNNIKGKKIVIVDACYSGGLINRSKKGEDKQKTFADSFIASFINGMQTRSSGVLGDDNDEYHVLVACSQSEMSNSLVLKTGKAFGLFTFYLQKAIGYDRLEWSMTDNTPGDTNEDMFLTLEEAYQYILDNVDEFTIEWNESHGEKDQIEQTVQVWPDNSSFVLFGRRMGN